MSGLKIEPFLINLENNKNVKEICILEKKYLDDCYSTIGSRKNAYSKYRMRVENSNLNDEIKNIVKNILKLSKKETKQFKLDHILQINSDHVNLRTINDVQGYIEMGISLIKNSSYIDKILGFCCVTGRRPAEIGCSADFSFVDSNHLIFDGQLKTKGSDSLKSYKIPILMNTNDFLIHWRFFREQYTKNLIDKNILKLDDFFTTQLTAKFHSNYSKDMSMRVKKYFKNFVSGEIQTKNLRPIYATISVNKFNQNSNKSSQKYIAEILGHSDNDLNTTNSYIDFKNI